MLSKLKSFTLKEKDFASGKMVAPSREFWESCACCGKAIVQGAILSNGDKIGQDCEELRFRAAMTTKDKAESLFKMFGTTKKAQQYISSAYF